MPPKPRCPHCDAELRGPLLEEWAEGMYVGKVIESLSDSEETVRAKLDAYATSVIGGP